jgi:hypothetical protein
MNYLEKWTESLLLGRSQPLTRTVRVEGVRKAHLGPRMDFAQVEFVVESADGFEVSIEVQNLEVNLEQRSFIDSAILGFLDVVMLAEPFPLKNIKLRVVGADFDPVSSNSMAFRLAGREAARKLLDEIRPGARAAPSRSS